MKNDKIRIAILDMNNNYRNQGLGNIKDIAAEFKESSEEEVTIEVFDVRYKCQIPKVEDYDIFIGSGGPGNPHGGEGKIWEEKYSDFLNDLWGYNEKNKDKKYAFLICHSFQMAVIHWDLATVNRRKSYSFGVMPIHKTEEGEKEFLYENLDDPFYAVDSRAFQCIQPNHKNLEKMGAKILCLEKIRPHVKLERAIMSIRFTDEIFGTQFHPEADPEGFIRSLEDEHYKKSMIDDFGLEKYNQTIERLEDENMIVRTRAQILPRFLREVTDKILHNQKEFA